MVATLFELLLLVPMLGLALIRPRLGEPFFLPLERGFRALARRKALSVALVGLLSFCLSAGLSLFCGWPEPGVHDEFCYLLASDTFAHGRLTNPTPPHWEHFEAHHLILHPTYQSKYPPGQGLFLAVGQVLAGEPIVGVWLSLALACAATCWMLQGWVSPSWALFGGLLAVLHGNFTWWGQMYWGGAVAMMGGALAWGAGRRILRQPDVGASAMLGLGLAVLAYSRPYEGLVASLPLAAILLRHLLGQRGPCWKDAGLRVVLPAALVLAAAAAWQALYNHSSTGDPSVAPYQVWQKTYTNESSFLSTLFFWNKAEPKSASEMRDIVYPNGAINLIKRPQPAQKVVIKVARSLMFFVEPLHILALAALVPVMRRRHMIAVVVAIVLVVLSDTFKKTSSHVHYLAPIASLHMLWVVQGLRVLRVWRRRQGGSGRLLVRLFLFAAAASLAVAIAVRYPQPRLWSHQRAQIQRDLEKTGERHLIIVRYPRGHSVHVEWAYNGADLENAPVIWARELGKGRQKALLDHFKDRKAWLLTVHAEDAELLPILRKGEVP